MFCFLSARQKVYFWGGLLRHLGAGQLVQWGSTRKNEPSELTTCYPWKEEEDVDLRKGSDILARKRPLEDQQRGGLEHRRTEGDSTEAFSLLTEQLGGRAFWADGSMWNVRSRCVGRLGKVCRWPSRMCVLRASICPRTLPRGMSVVTEGRRCQRSAILGMHMSLPNEVTGLTTIKFGHVGHTCLVFSAAAPPF